MEKNPTRDGKFSYYLYIIYLARSALSNFLSKFSVNFSHKSINFRYQSPAIKNFKLILFYKQAPFNYTIPRINFQDSTQVYPVFNSVATHPVLNLH